MSTDDHSLKKVLGLMSNASAPAGEFGAADTLMYADSDGNIRTLSPNGSDFTSHTFALFSDCPPAPVGTITFWCSSEAEHPLLQLGPKDEIRVRGQLVVHDEKLVEALRYFVWHGEMEARKR